MPGPSSTTTILGRFQVSLPYSNDIFCVFKPSARTPPAALHCGSHCHQYINILTRAWTQGDEFNVQQIRVELSSENDLFFYFSHTMARPITRIEIPIMPIPIP